MRENMREQKRHVILFVWRRGRGRGGGGMERGIKRSRLNLVADGIRRDFSWSQSSASFNADRKVLIIAGAGVFFTSWAPRITPRKPEQIQFNLVNSLKGTFPS